jgi:hypothetical protein
MSSRRWLLPVLLALPFAVVAVTDLYRVLVRHPPEGVSLLASVDSIQFEPTATVVDLRGDRPRALAASRHWSFELGPGWGELSPQGRWSESDRFEVVWTVPAGGQTALFIEGRIDRNQPRGSTLAVAVNGRHAGNVPLSRAITSHTLLLADAPLYAGDNRMELRIVDPRTGAGEESRTALVRRLAVAQDDSEGFPVPSQRAPLRFAADRRSVVVRVEGRLIVPFDVPASGTSLELRYRFEDPDPEARVRVVVARRYAGPNRYDVAQGVTLNASERRAGRLRQVLRDRGESSALLVMVNAAAARGGFVIVEPRILARPPRG